MKPYGKRICSLLLAGILAFNLLTPGISARAAGTDMEEPFESEPDAEPVLSPSAPPASEIVEYPVTGGALLFQTGSGKITGYTGSPMSVVIPAEIGGVPVTGIENDAFAFCGSLTSIDLPDGVTAIGEGAFYYCTSLTSIDLPDNLTSIGDWAFSNCTGLTSIELPDGVTAIGADAFYSCSRLQTIHAAAGNPVYSCIDGVLFNKAQTALLLFPPARTGSYTVPDSVTAIGDHAFFYCSGLTSIDLPDGVTAIGDYAFSDCDGLTSIELPDGVTAIGEGAFEDCIRLTSIELPDNLTTIGDFAFNYCTGLTSIDLPDTLTAMGNRTFASCTALTSIDLPDTLTAIGDYAFCFCTSLTGIELPDSVTAIGDHAFERCIRLTSIELPDSVTAVGDYAFYNCSGLTSIDLPDGVTAIGDYAFCYCTSLTSIGLPDGVTAIGDCAFNNCTGLTSIDLPDSVTAIGDRAFYYCRSLTSIGLPDTLTTIGGNAFSGCTKLTDVSYAGSEEQWAALTAGAGLSATAEVHFIPDYTPAQIVNVTAISDVSCIRLSWSISSEVLTETCRIFRRSDAEEDFRQLAVIRDRGTLSYTDDAVDADRVYYYYIIAESPYGTKSEPSLTAGASLRPDTEPPTVLRLTPEHGALLRGTAALGMAAQDNVQVVRSLLEYSADGGDTWQTLAEGTGGSLNAELDTAALPDGTLRLRGTAWDAAGNESAPLVFGYSVDNTGPEQITGLSAVCTSVTATLSWADAADDDIAFFRVEQRQPDGTFVLLADENRTLGTNLTGLTPDTAYTCRVTGYDRHGNRGVPSPELTFRTLPDTTAPVVTRLRPTAGYYSDALPVTASASDEYAIAALTLQLSRDGLEWADAAVRTFSGTSKTETAQATLSLSAYPEGAVYFRAVAEDAFGNLSDTGSSAPLVQYLIDRTPPAAPENAAAAGYSGYIEVSWTQGPEADLAGYAVYRASSPEGGFTLAAENIRALNWFDRSAEEGVEYRYQVAVRDQAGNESARSETAAAQVQPDAEAPVIVSVYPENGAELGAEYRTVSVLAADNRRLERVRLFVSTDGEHYSALLTRADIGSASCTVKVELPVEEYAHGGTVYVKALAEDQGGNMSEIACAAYRIDTEAPAAPAFSAAFVGDHVELRWNGTQEPDLLGYRIYRSTNGGGSVLVAQRQAVAGQLEYTCPDWNLSVKQTSYTYRINAVDRCGNAAASEPLTVTVPDRSSPTVSLSCEAVMEAGVEYRFDASGSRDDTGIVSWHLDFGDGTAADSASAVHAYPETGSYTVTVSVTDGDGNTSTLQKTVDVRERTLLGTVRILVADDGGNPVPNAPVYFDLGSPDQLVRNTDSSGCAVFTADVGLHAIGCIIADNSWLPAKKDVVVTAGEETTATLTMVRHVLVEGSFEIERMTFEEITAAGIDVSRPENQYYVTVHVSLVYQAREIETTFLYNLNTGYSTAKPIIYDSDSGKRALIPQVITVPRAASDDSVGVSVAYLDIPISVTGLKEFFEVRLHILNNASAAFSMLDNTVTLNVPDGLTLMETPISEPSASVFIDEIPGQSSHTVQWILRGDREDSYWLSADYSGILSEFGETVHTVFEAEDPLVVDGLSHVSMEIQIPETVEGSMFYYNIRITNSGGSPVLLPHVETGMEPEMLFLYDSFGRNLLGPDSGIADGTPYFRDGSLTWLGSGETVVWHYVQEDAGLYSERALWLEELAAECSDLYGLNCSITRHGLFDAPERFLHPIGNYIGKDGNLWYNGHYTSESDAAMQSSGVGSYEEDSGNTYSRYPFRYTDAFWGLNATEYHHDLATYCLSLAAAGYNRADTRNDKSAEGSLPGRDANVKELLLKCGFAESTFRSYDYDRATDLNTIACALAQKQLEDCTVLALVVRGGNYGREWGGDFYVGDQGTQEHMGFLLAKEQVLQWVEAYCGSFFSAEETRRKPIKLVITGYSRGAAAANLVAAAVDDMLAGAGQALPNLAALELTRENVFAYTFETPLNTTDGSTRSDRYDNIFNIVNPMDFVPKVAPAAWGFSRYGTDVFLPSASNCSTFRAVSNPMRFQYQAATSLEYPYEASLGTRPLDQTLDRAFEALALDVLRNRDTFAADYENVAMLLAAGTLGSGLTPEELRPVIRPLANLLVQKVVDLLFSLSNAAKNLLKGHPALALLEAIMAIEAEIELAFDREDFEMVAYLTLQRVSGDPSVSDFRKKELGNLLDLIDEALDQTNLPAIAYNALLNYDALGILPTYGSLLTELEGDAVFNLVTGNGSELGNIPNMHQPTVCLAWMRALAYNESWLNTAQNRETGRGLYRVVYLDRAEDAEVYTQNGQKAAAVNGLTAEDIPDSPVGVSVDYLTGRIEFTLPADADYAVSVTGAERSETAVCTLREYGGDGVISSTTYELTDLALNETEIRIDHDAPDLSGRYSVTSGSRSLQPDAQAGGSEMTQYCVDVETSGSGSVRGSGYAFAGELVALTAIPTADAAFCGWYEDGELLSSEAELRFLADGDRNLTAVFSERIALLTLSAGSAELEPDAELTLGCTVMPEEAAGAILLWSSDDETVLTVDENGTVHAHACGKATVTVKAANGVCGQLELTVAEKQTPVYTVTFVSAHGTAPEAQTAAEGETFRQPETPTEAGWDFCGWFFDEAGTAAYDFSAPAAADLILYAKWERQAEDPTPEEPEDPTPEEPEDPTPEEPEDPTPEVSEDPTPEEPEEPASPCEKSGHQLVFCAGCDAVCTKEGAEDRWVCEICGGTFADKNGTKPITEYSWILPALGHCLVYRTDVTAQFNVSGSRAHWECERCGMLFTDRDGSEPCSESDLILLPQILKTRAARNGQVIELRMQLAETAEPAQVWLAAYDLNGKMTDFRPCTQEEIAFMHTQSGFCVFLTGEVWKVFLLDDRARVLFSDDRYERDDS